MLAKSDYIEQLRVLQAVPIEDRLVWLSREGAENHRDDIEWARETMRDSETGEMSFTVKRTYGVRAAIITEVARWASEKFGTSVSHRTVRTCWDEKSAFVREVDRNV